jgi:peptide-methionine (R)-S-oxide reductase
MVINPLVNPNLTEQQKNILFEKGTETPFTGEYLNHKDNGMYTCANCGAEIFSSDTKFESGTGWPSFNNPKNSKAVKLHEDNSHGMQRTEVTCANCGGHLGHLFNDAADQPTGNRFCINSCALDFKPEKKKNGK